MKKLMEQISTPHNYFELSEEEKMDVCVGLLETIYELLIKKKGDVYSKLELMETVLDATIKYNEEIEHYEACAVLNDTLKLLDGQKDL
jgi:hypothetical protein